MSQREDMQVRLNEAVRGAIAGVLHKESLHPSCISCVHFKLREETCNLYQKRPPAKIIAYGCPQYMDNLGVPF